MMRMPLDFLYIFRVEAFYTMFGFKGYKIIFFDRKCEGIHVHENAFLAYEIFDKSITLSRIEICDLSFSNGHLLHPFLVARAQNNIFLFNLSLFGRIRRTI